MNKRNIFFIVLVFTIFLLTMGVTYAYFSIIPGQANSPNEVVVSTFSSDLLLKYTDSQYISMNAVSPGDYYDKTIIVENLSATNSDYNINWESLINTYQNNELVISATCTSYSTYISEGSSDNITSGTCENIEQTPIGNIPSIIKNNINIESSITHVYNFHVEFLELFSEQNYNQGAAFSGKLRILDGGETNIFYGRITKGAYRFAVLESKVIVDDSEEYISVNNEGAFSLYGLNNGEHTFTFYDVDNNILGTSVINISNGAENIIIDNTNLVINDISNVVYVNFLVGGIDPVLDLDYDNYVIDITYEMLLSSYRCSNRNSGSAPYILYYSGSCDAPVKQNTSDWKIKFTSGGSLTLIYDTKIDAFVVGGGGSGGANKTHGGGGGAGGKTNTIFNYELLAGNPYTIVVGTGGSGGDGGFSRAFGVTSSGGGAGSSGNSSVGGTGGSGGSGGGGGGHNGSGGYGGNGGSFGKEGTQGGRESGNYGGGQNRTTCEFNEGSTSGCTLGNSYAYSRGGAGGGGYHTSGYLSSGSNGTGLSGANSGAGGQAPNGSGASGTVVIRNKR